MMKTMTDERPDNDLILVAEQKEETVTGAGFVNIGRIPVPGGTLSLYTPNPGHPIELLKALNLVLARNPTHIGLRTAPELVRALEQAGFRVDRNEWRPSFYPLLRAVERLGGRRLQRLHYRLCLRARR